MNYNTRARRTILIKHIHCTTILIIITIKGAFLARIGVLHVYRRQAKSNKIYTNYPAIWLETIRIIDGMSRYIITVYYIEQMFATICQQIKYLYSIINNQQRTLNNGTERGGRSQFEKEVTNKVYNKVTYENNILLLPFLFSVIKMIIIYNDGHFSSRM